MSFTVYICPKCGEQAKPGHGWESGMDGAHTPYHHHHDGNMPIRAVPVETFTAEEVRERRLDSKVRAAAQNGIAGAVYKEGKLPGTCALKAALNVAFPEEGSGSSADSQDGRR